jgi:hypothetical protein
MTPIPQPAPIPTRDHRLANITLTAAVEMRNEMTIMQTVICDAISKTPEGAGRLDLIAARDAAARCLARIGCVASVAENAGGKVDPRKPLEKLLVVE